MVKHMWATKNLWMLVELAQARTGKTQSHILNSFYSHISATPQVLGNLKDLLPVLLLMIYKFAVQFILFVYL